MRSLDSRRGWIALCSGVLVLLIGLGLLGEALGGGPQGPLSSSYATNAKGLAAYSELLSREGHPVTQLRTSLAQAQLDPASTVVVLDPDALLSSEGRRLLDFVTAGGQLLIGGREPQSTLPAVISNLPPWSPGAGARELPAPGRTRTLTGVTEVASAGEGGWSLGSLAGFHALLIDGSGAGLLLERSYGRGKLELLADVSPLQNRLLASADNAQLALNLAGGPGRPVSFVESVHGFGEQRGLAALPGRWWLTLGCLGLAGLLWVLARARRLGAPEPTAMNEPLPRSDYVEAIALLLRRTNEPQELASSIRRLRDRG
jgi:uncharacterized protein DUF4350